MSKPRYKSASPLMGPLKLCSFVNHAIYEQTRTDDCYGPGHRHSGSAEPSSRYPIYRKCRFNNNLECFSCPALDALCSASAHCLGKAQLYRGFQWHHSSTRFWHGISPTRSYMVGPGAAGSIYGLQLLRLWLAKVCPVATFGGPIVGALHVINTPPFRCH